MKMPVTHKTAGKSGSQTPSKSKAAKCVHRTGLWTMEVFIGPDGKRRKDHSLTRQYRHDPTPELVESLKGCSSPEPILIITRQVVRPARQKADYTQLALPGIDPAQSHTHK